MAAPSRRELDFSIAVKKRDQTQDYLQKVYCANQPGDAMDPDSDEFKIQEMLLKDPADVDEDLWKVLQQRVDRRRNIGLQVRQTVGRSISPNVTTKQMETGVYASIDLGEFNAAVKAESWAAKMREWLENPATIERYLDILPELEFW